MILVYLENEGELLPKSARVAISAALTAKSAHGYDQAVGVILGDQGAEAAANEATKFGLDEVVYCSQPELGTYLALSHAAALLDVCGQISPKLVMGCAGTLGKDLFPRVAQGLGAGQASDVLEFVQGGTFKRPMYAGNIIAEVELTTETKVATIRSTAFDAATESGKAASVRKLDISLGGISGQEFVGFETVESERPDLTEADVVISGGRALKSAENFEKILAPLADVLNAAIGASRAAVDSGYAPNDWQVGQTGKVVAPSLYIAIGISGAIQHLAGMKDSKVIVAINTDEEAPIFELADYGLVADLFDAVPELVEKIQALK